MLKLVTGLIAAMIASLSVAHATLSLTVLDNGTPVAGTENNAGGTLTFTGTNAAFTSISITVTGVPAIPSPDLGTINVDAHSGASIGSHILTVEAVQSGLTGFTGGNVSSTFTVNTLIGAPGPTIMSNKFAGALLASHTFPVGAATDTFSAVNNVGAQAGPFTDEQDLIATFTGGSELLQTTAQLKAVSTVEPAGIAIFGVGLLALVGLRRNYKGGKMVT